MAGNRRSGVRQRQHGDIFVGGAKASMMAIAKAEQSAFVKMAFGTSNGQLNGCILRVADL
jgi:hypothetical protein